MGAIVTSDSESGTSASGSNASSFDEKRHTKGDILAGHAGHLTPDQKQSYASFVSILQQKGLYTAASESSTASHDETTLLRFLRARRFDPAEAYKQFAATEAWREEYDVDNLFENFNIAEFEDAKRFYPRWTGRRALNGRPLYVYPLAALAPLRKELEAIPPAKRYQRIIVLYEIMTRFVTPLSSYLLHESSPTPIPDVVTIIDLQGVSLSTMWHFRNHLQTSSVLATANYPETLHTIAVVNAPSFFPTIWGWIKGWFDEHTREKIHILGRDPGSALRKLVAPADLPKIYGGELDWMYKDAPNLDAETERVIGTMPKGPAAFVDGRVLCPPNSR